MNDFGSARPKSWSVYTSANPSTSQTGGSDREAALKNFGMSLNAIAFGFVATAILVSMFLIMAIFEHLLRSRSSSMSPRHAADGSLESGTMRDRIHTPEKLANPQNVSTSYWSNLSVLMPGQHCPTFIAQPAPLSCPREGISWPSHDHGFASP